MKLKKEYFLLGAVIIGLFAYLVFKKTDWTHYQLPVISEVSKDEISKLQIKTADSTIDMKKKGAAWVIGPKEYPADADRVKEMLDAIASLKLTALISESKNYIRYDLNQAKKLAVKALSGETVLREFEIGKAASTYQHTFVKLAGDPNVYHARGYFRTKFDNTLDTFRNHSVLTFPKEKIREVEIVNGKDKFIIAGKETPDKKTEDKTEKKPSDAPPKKVDGEKLNRLVSNLSDLECESYLEGADKKEFKDPVFSVTLKGEKEHTLSVFPKTKADADDYPAISSDSPYVFLLSDSRVDSFKKTVEEEKKAEKTQ
jgi:Domain of unknown function (DUF4340)